MVLDTQKPKINILQITITFSLVLVLLGIVAGYIYYGMRVAALPIPVDDVVPTALSTSTTNDIASTSPAVTQSTSSRRLSTLAELAAQSSSTLTVTERSAIVRSMMAESPDTAENRATRLNLLEAMKAVEDEVAP